MVRVRIPYHLQTLAGTGPELRLEVPEPVTAEAVVRALEARHPGLRGAVYRHETGTRRPLIRFFACGRDISLDDDRRPLPGPVRAGREPFHIVGAIAGG